MSTKIYNGYIAKNTSIEALYPHLLVASEYVFSYLERELLLEAERIENSDKDISSTGLIHELRLLKDEKGHDFDSSIVLFPCEGDVLILLFGGSKVESLYTSKLPMVEDYFYFNNSEEPDEISLEEWEERGRRWDIVMPSGIANKTGLILENSFRQTQEILWYTSSEHLDEIRNRKF